MILLQVPDYTQNQPTTALYTWSQSPDLEDLRTDEFLASVSYASGNLIFLIS